MSPPSPEARARENIDAQLVEAGWAVQNHKDLDLSAGRGVAVREFPLAHGAADYLLYVNRRAVGVVEAINGVGNEFGAEFIGIEARGFLRRHIR